MAGISLAGYTKNGYAKRIPCPHCGSDDCAMIQDEKSVCMNTGKVITEQQLLAQLPLFSIC